MLIFSFQTTFVCSCFVTILYIFLDENRKIETISKYLKTILLACIIFWFEMLYLEFLPLLTCQKKNKMANTKSERRKSIQTKYTMTISRKIYFCLLFCYYYLFCSFLRLILAHSMVYFHKFHKVFFSFFSSMQQQHRHTKVTW